MYIHKLTTEKRTDGQSRCLKDDHFQQVVQCIEGKSEWKKQQQQKQQGDVAQFQTHQIVHACLGWCKFQKDLIETKWAMSWTRSSASNATLNCLIWPECVVFRDFMPFLFICQFYKDPIKMSMLDWRYGQIWGFSCTQGQVTPNKYSDPARIRTRLKFYACSDYLQVWRWSNENWICYPGDTDVPL